MNSGSNYPVSLADGPQNGKVLRTDTAVQNKLERIFRCRNIGTKNFCNGMSNTSHSVCPLDRLACYVFVHGRLGERKLVVIASRTTQRSFLV